MSLWAKALVLLVGYAFLLLTSGRVVNGLIGYVSREDLEAVDKKTRDTGFLIGKCENILIPTFVLFHAFTALTLIFAAKALVRREDLSRNTLYFLAGTMINFTYSLVVGVLLHLALSLS